jgi:hypothetical protein
MPVVFKNYVALSFERATELAPGDTAYQLNLQAARRAAGR